MMRLALFVLCLLAMPVMAAAQVAAPENAPLRVLVLGDAMGSGLGAGLARIAEPSGDYDVSSRFTEESGLARPEVYDWPASVPKMLGSNSYGVIVVLLGANDTQAIRVGELRIAFGAEGWAGAYGAQVDRMLDALALSGARIIWVAPPPMRDPDYDAAIREIATIQRDRVTARGLTFLDMRARLSNDDGTYAETGPDDTGTVTRLRGSDGISFYRAGNNLMGQIVLAAIRSGGSAAPAVPPEAEQDTPANEDVRQVPLFGQTLMGGESYTVQPEGVTANVVMLTAAGLDPRDALKALRDLSPHGSNAGKLFRYGHVPAVPAGRADDFAVTAQE